MTDYAVSSSEFTFHLPPKPVGYWVLYPKSAYQTKFGMHHKPTDEQIKNTEQLLGWGWEDAKETTHV